MVKQKRSWSKSGGASGGFARFNGQEGYVFGGIDRQSFTMSYFSRAKLLIRTHVFKCLKEAIAQKRPVLANRKEYKEHARTRGVIVTRQNSPELGWEIIKLPPCCSDLAPSDYYLFLSGANDLFCEIFTSSDACEYRLF